MPADPFRLSQTGLYCRGRRSIHCGWLPVMRDGASRFIESEVPFWESCGPLWRCCQSAQKEACADLRAKVCRLVRLLILYKRRAIQRERVLFQRKRKRKSFQFERQSFRIIARVDPSEENFQAVARVPSIDERSIEREKPFHFGASMHLQ